MGMGPLQPINTNTPVNPWEMISGAINTGIEARKNSIKEQQDRQAALQQQQQTAQMNQMDLQAKQSEVAKAQIAQITPMLLQNPKYANDPNTMKAVDDIFARMHIPTPKNPDGTLNLDSFKQPLPDDLMRYVMSLSPEMRKPILDNASKQYAGITPDMYTGEQVMTPKEQANISYMSAKAKELGITGDVAQRREHNRELWTQMNAGKISAETQKLQADTGLIRQNTAKSMAETQAIPMRLQIMQQNANTSLMRAQAYLQNRGSLTKSNWSQVMGQFRDVQSEYNRYESDLKGLQTQQIQLKAQGVPDDDPQMAQVDAQVDVITKQMGALKPTVDKLNDYMAKNVNDIIAGNAASQMSGKPAKLVGAGASGGARSTSFMAAPSGVGDGHYPNTKWGEVWVKNGQVYRQDPG